MEKITVIIPTCNHSALLKDTLASLLRQNNNGSFDYEILIVDNNSKDNTKEIVESYFQRFNNRLHYLFEKRQGSSYAKNKGIGESVGDIIAFTDDDCLPEENWLLKIVSKFADDKEISCILGGAIWENGETMFKENHLLRGNGLNMSFKKQIFNEIGGFDIYLGPGSVGCSGEDTDLIYRAIRRGIKVCIAEEILVTHRSRISPEGIKKYYRDCKGLIIFNLKYILKKRDIACLKNIIYFLKSSLSLLFNGITKSDKNKIFDGIIQLAGLSSGLLRGLYIWLILVPVSDWYKK